MRIRVSHETNLKFSAPVRTLQLVLRMTPRSFDSQYVQRWRVGVDLDASLKAREDSFGNVVHSLAWLRPVQSVTITATGEAQTTDAVGVVRGAVDNLPEGMFLRESPLARANAALRGFANDAGQGEVLDRLHGLMAALHEEIAFEPVFGGEASAAEVFALKKGGAADFAHMFIACARAADIPSRFVTGYRVDEDSPEASDMFAWAEAFAPGLGWVAFDAVHDLCANDSYVRVACGLDAKDAAPARFWTSGAETVVTARLRVEQSAGQTQN